MTSKLSLPRRLAYYTCSSRTATTTTTILSHNSAIALPSTLPSRHHHHHVWIRVLSLSLRPSLLLLLPVARFFGTTNSPPLSLKAGSKSMPPRPKPPPEEEIGEAFLRGSGPGGQKINKTSSAVQLKHLPTGLVVKSQATRSRTQNRTIARRLLADKLDDMARGDESRSSVVGEVKRKKKASAAKKSRRKYRKLDDEKGVTTGGALEDNNSDVLAERLSEEGSDRDGGDNTADEATLDRTQQARI
ncbi:RF-1 domain-containing protein [Xylaria castorea]|nr:RF-1 domain-containing protein [Xylaria castorea]